jgi:hypothetical protein
VKLSIAKNAGRETASVLLDRLGSREKSGWESLALEALPNEAKYEGIEYESEEKPFREYSRAYEGVMRDADMKCKVAISLAIPCFFQRLTKLITIRYTNH